MSYQVLARKWRPRIFSEMVGQEHVLRALINALDNERLHHAYLFTGTRGVGKTTIARILAKCLNCEQGVSSTPCGECSACVSIAEGRFVDLIEVDAASRTKVEDTRELLENVQYAPTVGRYKVYLIDEVHMLSTHSFNALLKTLEEPPPHVKFLLATTDPQKLPVTILSRCLQFNLKNLSPERIVEHLQHVMTEEQVPCEESGLWALARAADGSMRDALSLTDQAIAHGGGKLTESEVSTMLGTIDLTAIADIARALVNNDGTEVLAVVQKMSEHAPDYSAALADLLSVWHRVAIAQTVPDALDNRHGDYQLIQELAKALSREDVQLYYQIVLLGRRDLSLAPDPRTGFEMVMLRMLAFQPVRESRLDPPLETSSTTETAPTVETAPIEEKSPETSVVESAPTSITETAFVSEEADFLTKKSEAASTGSSVEGVSIGDETEVLAIQPKNQVDAQVENQVEAQLGKVDTIVDGRIEPSFGETFEDYPELDPALESHAAEPSGHAAIELSEEAPLADEVLAEMSHQAHNQSALVGTPTDSGISSPDTGDLADNHTSIDQNLSQNPLGQSKAIQNNVVQNRATQDKLGQNGAVHDKVIQKIPMEQVEPNRWIEVYQGLSVGGVLQNIAANLALVEVNGNAFRFELDINESSLYEENHKQRFADVLAEYFGQPVNVEIEVGSVVSETPQAYRLRIREERQQEALESLKNDPSVRRIMDVFGGVLLEKTVKPID